MFDTQKILDGTDLVELARRAGAEPRKVGSSYRSKCPLHGGDNDSAFAIFNDRWQCFSGDCGGGDAIAFVMKWQNMDFQKACEFLGGDTLSDPAEMTRLASERAQKARNELEKAIQRAEAARAELRAAQIHLYYHQTMPELCRQKWMERGLTEKDIDFFDLGGKADYALKGWHTPTLTIPIFDEQRNLLNVKHRLIHPNPEKPNDKYRPEREGLGAFPPFLAVPELGYDGTIWVVEGEIKAMVTWARCGDADTQVIGVPGRSNYRGLIERLVGKNIVVVPDVGAEKDALEFAKAVKGRFLMLPEKIDDFIVANEYDRDWLKHMERQARHV